MIKRLSRHGNSLALVIEKGVLDLLNIHPDTPLEITTDGARLVITPRRKRAGHAPRPSVVRAGPRDRSAEVYAAAVRGMTLEQKLRVSEGLRDLAWQAKAASLARRHPDWPAQEVDKRVREVFLGGRA